MSFLRIAHQPLLLIHTAMTFGQTMFIPWWSSIITLMKTLTEIDPLPVRVALTQRMSELPPPASRNN